MEADEDTRLSNDFEDWLDRRALVRWLRYQREIRHVTQEQMAAALHVSQARISELESTSDCYPDTIQRYARALGMQLTFGVSPRS